MTPQSPVVNQPRTFMPSFSQILPVGPSYTPLSGQLKSFVESDYRYRSENFLKRNKARTVYPLGSNSGKNCFGALANWLLAPSFRLELVHL